MACKTVLSPLALKELEDSSDWYEERAFGLGELFITFIYKAFTAIATAPEAYPEKKNNYREFTLVKFPYVVIYEFDNEEDIVYILHVFHTSRNPKLKYKSK